MTVPTAETLSAGASQSVFDLIIRSLRNYLSLAVLASGVSVANAQDVSYGTPEDLSGALWVFVYTGTQMSEREDIMEKLKKELPYLRFAKDPRQADMVIIYASAQSDVFAGNWQQAIGGGTATCSSIGASTTCRSSGQGSGYTTPLYIHKRYGRGLVLIRDADDQLRLVIEHSDKSNTGVFSKSPHSKFVSRFVKEYRNKTRPSQQIARPGVCNLSELQHPETQTRASWLKRSRRK